MKNRILWSLLTTLSILFVFQRSAVASINTFGLSMWLDASSGVTTSGSNVTSWTDLSGNGHNASQSTVGAQPVLVSNGINGLPAVQFNGSSNFLNVSGQVLTSQQFTILGVVTQSNSTSFYQEVFSNWSSTNSTTSVFLGTATLSGTTRARFTDQMGGQVDGNLAGVGLIANPSTPFIYTGLSGSTDATIYQNTSLVADKGSALSALDLTTPYNLGTQSGFEFWGGDVGALLVYDRALSSAELQQDWTALAQEFNIPNVGVVPEPAALTVWLLLSGSGFAWFLRRRRLKGVPS